MKIVVCDFDNTLYLHNKNRIIRKRILKKNLFYLKKIVKKGNIFILATGRDFEGIYKEIVKYNILFNYLICNNGADIYDNNYRCLYVKEINSQDLEFLKKIGFLMYYDKCRKHITCAKFYNYNIGLLDKVVANIKKSKIEITNEKIKIYPNDLDKYYAIKFLIGNTNEVYCFGDSKNDYLMLSKYKGYTLCENIEKFNDINVIGIKNIGQQIKKIIE